MHLLEQGSGFAHAITAPWHSLQRNSNLVAGEPVSAGEALELKTLLHTEGENDWCCVDELRTGHITLKITALYGNLRCFTVSVVAFVMSSKAGEFLECGH